ncbi:MAG: hypothetical protein D6767_04165 [Candidatus Hydrogenedentota bacterium]|nr:MAG: hypothetical protein D6767_04165 [Candidatus Hydrogenedentota bacterium]
MSIGSFQLGMYTGLNPDPNSLNAGFKNDAGDNASGNQRFLGSRKDNMDFYNALIQQTIDEGNGTGSVTAYPLGVTVGFDFRYLWNAFFIRLAVDYTQMITGTKAELKSGTYSDSISYKAWNGSVPMSFGFAHELDDFFMFYLAAGPYYAWAYSSVTHSEPLAFENTALGSGSPFIPYKSQQIQGHVFGYNILVGIEIPLITKKLYMSVDFMHYQARSGRLQVNGENSDGTPINDSIGDTITLIGNKFTFGILYHIPMSASR